MLTHGAGSPRTRMDTGEELHRVTSPPVTDSGAAAQCHLACAQQQQEPSVSAQGRSQSCCNVRLNGHVCSKRVARGGGACGQASMEDRALTYSSTYK